MHVYITDSNFHKLIFLPQPGCVACMHAMQVKYKFEQQLPQ